MSSFKMDRQEEQPFLDKDLKNNTSIAPIKANNDAEEMENVKFEAAMEIAGFGKFSVFAIFLSALTIGSAFTSSIDASFLLPAAQCDLNLSSDDKGLLGSAFFLGAISVSHLVGFLADTLGRKYVLVRGLWGNFIVYILGSVAPNFWTLFILKLLSGMLSAPCYIATFPFLGEYVPTQHRFRSVMVATACSILGLAYSTLVAWATLLGQWEVDLWLVKFTPWRLFFLICGVPALISAILFCIIPESPKFVLTRGKKEETLRILKKVYSINSGKEPNTYPVQSLSLDASDVAPPDQKKGVLGILKHIVDQTTPLFKPPFVKNLILCIVLMFTILLCNNTTILWLPEVLNRIAFYQEGHKGDSYLCQMVMKEPETNSTAGGVSEECLRTVNSAVFVPNLVVGTLQPVLMVTAGFVVNYVDKKLLMVVVMVLCSGVSFFSTWVPEATLVIIMFGAIPIIISISYNILTSLLVKLFPTYIRAMAVSLVMVCGRLGSASGSKIFSRLIDSHCPLLFQLLAGLLICTAILPLCISLKDGKPEKPAEPSETNNTSV